MKIESKMTAVQWLLNEWQSLETTLPQSLIVKVLEMEKQQIIDAYCFGCKDIIENEEIFPIETSEQYYNETFNNED